MPIYEYKCNSCGKDFDLLVNSGTKIECKTCSSADVTKKLSVFGFSVGTSQPDCASGCGGGFSAGTCGSGMCGGR